MSVRSCVSFGRSGGGSPAESPGVLSGCEPHDGRANPAQNLHPTPLNIFCQLFLLSWPPKRISTKYSFHYLVVKGCTEATSLKEDYLHRVMTQQSIKLCDVTSSRRLLLLVQWRQICILFKKLSNNEICDIEFISCVCSVPCGFVNNAVSAIVYRV